MISIVKEMMSKVSGITGQNQLIAETQGTDGFCTIYASIYASLNVDNTYTITVNITSDSCTFYYIQWNVSPLSFNNTGNTFNNSYPYNSSQTIGSEYKGTNIPASVLTVRNLSYQNTISLAVPAFVI